MPSYSGIRFSLDVGEDGFLLNNGPTGVDYLQSTIQVPQSKSSLNGSLLSHSSSQLPVRRRASTSSALLFSPSNLGEDPFFGDLSYDGDPFETSQGNIRISHQFQILCLAISMPIVRFRSIRPILWHLQIPWEWNQLSMERHLYGHHISLLMPRLCHLSRITLLGRILIFPRNRWMRPSHSSDLVVPSVRLI